MTNLDPKARERAQQIARKWMLDNGRAMPYWEGEADKLAQLLLQVQAEGLEQAAKLCDETYVSIRSISRGSFPATAEVLAAKFRSLAAELKAQAGAEGGNNG